VEHLGLQQRYPGIQGLGFSRRVALRDLATLTSTLRSNGLPEFHVWPEYRREEYYPVVYLEPLDRRNRAVLGFDMFTEPTRRAAMERARDSGSPAMSGKTTLKQEIESAKQVGFLIYVPVYREGRTPETVEGRRASLQGFVYSPFRAADLFDGIFGSEREPRVAFRVYDGPTVRAEQLLYDSHTGRSASPAFSIATTLKTAAHTWTLVFTSLPSFEASSERPMAFGILAAGTLVSLVLFAVTRSEVQARSAAERSEALRSRFFAVMSHELRTPLNAIIGYNSLLLDGTYGLLSEAQLRGIERSQQAAKHLLELVNDVLDMSKLEAGKIEIEATSVHVPALITELFSTLRAEAENRGCELTLDCHITAPVATDPRRLRQILLNLLSNATKFGAGRPVHVRCAESADEAWIEVEDQGPGIAPNDIHRIFEEFVQLPHVAAGGTGLGLPISRRLAELLGGRLEVESTLGHGSTFRIVLPKRPRAA
jgi:signal transduction histidine kinase